LHPPGGRPLRFPASGHRSPPLSALHRPCARTRRGFGGGDDEAGVLGCDLVPLLARLQRRTHRRLCRCGRPAGVLRTQTGRRVVQTEEPPADTGHDSGPRTRVRGPESFGTVFALAVVGAANGADAANAQSRAALTAVSTTFLSSRARVIGPTPPGFGETQAATSATAGSTSPTIFDLPVSGSVARETPTSRTIAPGLTASAVTIPAEPAAATMTSAWASSSSWLRVAAWVSVVVALCSRRVGRAPIDRPTVTPRPITPTCLPLRSIPLRVISSMTPRGVHGSGVVISELTLSTSRPRFVGCRPSASLAGSMASRMVSVSIWAGNGSWTM